MAEASHAELCVLGSDFLDRILTDASGRGFHCIARVDVASEPPAEDVLAANLTFPNATAKLVAVDRGPVPYLLFNFRVTLMTDEKRELMKSVLINTETLTEHTAKDAFLQESFTLPEEIIVSEQELAAAYQSACGALEQSILTVVEEVRAKANTLLAQEMERIDAFYATSIQELYSRRIQSPLAAERVFRAEQVRRTEEAKRKYGLGVTARLVNARTILIPTSTLTIRLANPQASKDFHLEYDALNLETNRPPCDSCETPTEVAYLCSRGHLACDACNRACGFCEFVACSKCAIEILSSCASCIRKSCPDHTFQDAIGRKTYCPDHIHACAICGRMVGPPYVNPCALCAQSYCAVCVEGGGKCTTCRTLAAIPPAHPDVSRVTAAKGEPRNLSRWTRGQNGRYAVLLGKGTLFQYLYVLDKEGKVILRRKGMSLA